MNALSTVFTQTGPASASEGRGPKSTLRMAVLILFLCPALFAASGKFVITRDIRNVLSLISADSLRSISAAPDCSR